MEHPPNEPDEASRCADLAAQLIAVCAQHNWKLATVESLTGGLLAARIVDIPGASKVFVGAIVSYADELKTQLLGVDSQVLARQTPYCSEVACQMAKGGAKLLGAHVVIATTGVAGPGKDRGVAPGTVDVGVQSSGVTRSVPHHFHGERPQVRSQAVAAALADCLQVIAPNSFGA